MRANIVPHTLAAVHDGKMGGEFSGKSFEGFEGFEGFKGSKAKRLRSL